MKLHSGAGNVATASGADLDSVAPMSATDYSPANGHPRGFDEAVTPPQNLEAEQRCSAPSAVGHRRCRR